jgi:hypothetical protein
MIWHKHPVFKVTRFARLWSKGCCITLSRRCQHLVPLAISSSYLFLLDQARWGVHIALPSQLWTGTQDREGLIFPHILSSLNERFAVSGDMSRSFSRLREVVNSMLIRTHVLFNDIRVGKRSWTELPTINAKFPPQLLIKMFLIQWGGNS